MPDPAPVRLELLADHLDLVPTVARWHWREWGEEDDELDEAKWVAVVGSRTGRDEVPFTLIAFVDEQLVGSLSVCADDTDAEFADEGPWLSGMFVRPPARDLGIGRQLVAEVERRATAAGHRTLWAHTAEAERFYVRCGWEVVRPKEPMRRDAVVRRSLS